MSRINVLTSTRGKARREGDKTKGGGDEKIIGVEGQKHEKCATGCANVGNTPPKIRKR